MPFWGEIPRNFKNLKLRPQKGPPSVIPRRLSAFARKSVNRYGRGAIPRKKKRKKVTEPVYNTNAWGRHRLSYLDHTWQFWLTP